MPQISLYIDKETLKEITERARAEKLSISKWVLARVKKTVKDEYPPGFFDLCGIFKDEPIERPPQIPFEYDAPREQI